MSFSDADSLIREVYRPYIEAQMRAESALRDAIIRRWELDMLNDWKAPLELIEPWSQLPEGF